MKRKTVVKVTVIVLAVIALFLLVKDYFIPQPIVRDVQDAQFFNVLNLNKEVTVGTEEVIDILEKYESVKSFKDYFPYQQADEQIEINMVINDKPFHLLLGNFNVWYESGDWGTYDIINGEQLLNEMTDLLK